MSRIIFATFALVLLGFATHPSPTSAQVMGQQRYLFLLADNFEQAPGLEGRPIRLEGDVWYGGAYDRLWLKLDGDADTDRSGGEVEAQALLSHLISPYWDLQVGMRVDGLWGAEDRAKMHLTLGLQGLAPYWFEVESAVSMSTAGDVSASLQASYDVLFTQRLMLEPELSVRASVQDQPEWGLASGLNDAELGLRLRYEIRREFAPYLGYVWTRRFGGTADLLRSAGIPWREGSLVAGLRMWY